MSAKLQPVSSPFHEAAAQYALALDFIAKSDAQSADAAFRRALALWPEHVDAQYDHARLLARTGDWPQAASAFRRLVELSPHFTQARVELGQVLLELGQANEAIEVFESALADEPENPIALTSLGIVLRETDRLPEAAAVLRRALVVAVPLEEAYQTMTGVLVDQGDFAGAEEVLVRGEGSIADPKKRARLQLSLACLMAQQGRAEEAIVWLRRGCSTDPENPSLETALAEALEEAKPGQ